MKIKKTLLAILTLCVMFSMLPLAAGAVALNSNLVQNPAAENGINNWTGDVYIYESPQEEMGTKVFCGGELDSASMYQDIQIDKSFGVSAGNVTAKMSAEIGGWAEQRDNATVKFVFYNKDGKELETFDLGPVTNDERNNTTKLIAKEVTSTVPSETSYVRVEVNYVKYDGSAANDGYVKNVSLVLTKPSAPSDIAKFILTAGKTDASVFGTGKQNDVVPKVVNGISMLPSRFVAENLGAVVVWDGKEQKATYTKDDTTIILYVGSDKALVNGQKVPLSTAVFIENNRVYVPMQFMCDSLDVNVSFDKKTQKTIITRK